MVSHLLNSDSIAELFSLALCVCPEMLSEAGKFVR